MAILRLILIIYKLSLVYWTKNSLFRRFKVVSEAVPAPNTYSLPSTGIYKYGQTVHSTILLKRPENIESLAPPPNRYYLPKTKGPAKTFGRKDGHKRAVYLTVDDLWE